MKEIAHLYSLEEIRHSFNITKIEEVVPVTISSDPNKYVPSGSPGIATISSLVQDKKLKNTLFGDERGKFVSVSFPFPTKVGNPGKLYTEVYQENIRPLPQKNLITNHKIKTIEEFEKDKLREIGNYVASNAAITFVMPDLSNVSEFWNNIYNLCSKYKYTVSFNHSVGARSRQFITDEFIPFVSFIDILYCIPIFDYRKIDGMGVCCGFMYKNDHEKNRETVIIESVYFVLSNYQANLLYLDGVTIGIPTKINANVLNHMLSTIEKEINYRNLTSEKKKTIVSRTRPPTKSKKAIISDFRWNSLTTTAIDTSDTCTNIYSGSTL